MFTHKKDIYAAGSSAYGAANRMGHSAMEGARGVGRSMNSMGNSAMQGMSKTYQKGLDRYHQSQYNAAKAQLARANQAMGQYGKYGNIQ